MNSQPGDSVCKVCFVAHSSAMRGAERALLEAIEALQSYPIQAHVFVPGDGPFVGELNGLGVEYSLYPALPWTSARRTLGKRTAKCLLMLPLALHLASLLRREHCQLVYTNTVTIPTGALASALLGLPHVWHIHEFGQEDHGFEFDPDQHTMKWFFQRYGGFFVFNSKKVADKYVRWLELDFEPARWRVIYQSVTPLVGQRNATTPLVPAFERVLTLVGALEDGKGHRDALFAVRLLKDRGIHVGLILVGEGSKRQFLSETAAELGIADRLLFTGTVDNVTDFYDMADVVLVCSKSEAFGRVAVEGMLRGRPIICTGSGGLSEIVVDGETGLYYEGENSVDLADRIQFLFEHQDFALRMAKRGQEWATHNFTKERYGKELFEVIRNVLQQYH